MLCRSGDSAQISARIGHVRVEPPHRIIRTPQLQISFTKATTASLAIIQSTRKLVYVCTMQLRSQRTIDRTCRRSISTSTRVKRYTPCNAKYNDAFPASSTSLITPPETHTCARSSTELQAEVVCHAPCLRALQGRTTYPWARPFREVFFEKEEKNIKRREFTEHPSIHLCIYMYTST